jgi:hypothetical protein
MPVLINEIVDFSLNDDISIETLSERKRNEANSKKRLRKNNEQHWFLLKEFQKE